MSQDNKQTPAPGLMSSVALAIASLLMLTSLTAGGAPDAAALGVPVYPGAKYEQALSTLFTRASAPGTTYAVFVTADAITKVADFYRPKLTSPGDVMTLNVTEASLYQIVMQYAAAFPPSQDPQAQAAARKWTALLKTSAGKKGKLTMWSGTRSGRDVQMQIQRPRLTPQADLVDETAILIHSRRVQ